MVAALQRSMCQKIKYYIRQVATYVNLRPKQVLEERNQRWSFWKELRGKSSTELDTKFSLKMGNPEPNLYFEKSRTTTIQLFKKKDRYRDCKLFVVNECITLHWQDLSIDTLRKALKVIQVGLWAHCLYRRTEEERAILTFHEQLIDRFLFDRNTWQYPLLTRKEQFTVQLPCRDSSMLSCPWIGRPKSPKLIPSNH